MIDLFSIINLSITITLFVFLMMLIIDYLNVATKGKLEKSLKGGKGRQYIISSFLGATPGCLGAFMNVSFYVHGLMGFGAIVGGMIATSGDEAFVMLALFPGKAFLLFSILFILGILGAWFSDKIASRLGIIPCRECDLQVVHPDDNCRCFDLFIFKKSSKVTPLRYGIFLFLLLIIVILGLGIIGPEVWNLKKVTIFSGLLLAIFILITVPDHFLKEHIWNHIIKKHLLRVFLWTFFALLFINIGFKHLNIEAFVRSNMGWVFLISALLGLMPESGPHMVFVMMFASGVIPFSILLTSSIVQDGHGMLPLFSYSVKDALLIKLFNLLFALVIGLPLLLIGW